MFILVQIQWWTAMARKLRIDMTGLRFGRLVGVAFDHRSASGHARWRFLCDCGREVVADGRNVRAGSTASCGCLHRERSAARLTLHGHRAARRHDPTYRAWQQLRRVAGDHVWAGWKAFASFIDDPGERPAGTKLARRDPAAPFGPANCYWEAVETRASRAARGWLQRRVGHDHPPAARAFSSQSRSSPAAAAIIRASTVR
jgi:hypothetical protein